ncbi:MAG: hypothetical protein M9938_05065 [Solirubrobacterales bacterium]|nr:hypothetical protein [Solirubrobacterales bacterium]
MSIVVWFTVALALWHFTIFIPDRFWQGIIGAFLGCVIGGLISGAVIELALGRSLSDTDLLTLVTAIPGTILGAWFVYWLGSRHGEDAVEH